MIINVFNFNLLLITAFTPSYFSFLYVPPAVEQIQNVIVKEGRNVTKECKVTAGTPTAAVSWESVETGDT